MIASIEGIILATADDHLVVGVSGVGLKVYVTSSLKSARVGDTVRLQTHLVVREDLLALYGFETPAEREFFLLLLGVNGVGPRIAMAILSTLSVDAIRRAVLSEQSEVFARVPGVGKKTAQKILLHLQGKVSGGDVMGEILQVSDVDAEVLDALTGLGYSVVEAQSALQAIPRDAPKDVETRLRHALQYFSS
jgi:Holliday junction DNA helicase RuvA